MTLRAFYGCGAARFTQFLALLVFPFLAATAASAVAGDASVADAEYSVRADGKFATVTATLSVLASGEGWSSLALLPESAVLRSCEVRGKRGYVQRGAEHYTAELLGQGKYSVALKFILDVQEQGPERFIKLPLIRSAGGRVLLDLDGPNCAVRLSPEAPMEIRHEAGRTRATLVPGGADALTVRWLPEELAKEGATIFEAREESVLTVQSGVVRRLTGITVTVQRGELDALVVSIPKAVDVLGLSARGVREAGAGKESRPSPDLLMDWHIEELAPGAVERKMRVRLARPLGGEFMLQYPSEQLFDPSAAAVSVRPFVVEGASRQSGVIGLRSPPTLTLIEAGSTGLNRAAARAFSPALGIAPVSEWPLVYEYLRLPAELKLKIEVIPARITAGTASRVKLQAGVVELTSLIVHHIENAPVERLHIGLSEGLIVLGVAGDDVETWEVKDGQIEVRLKRPVIGDHLLTVRCIENLQRVNGTLIPRLRCVDAERESGSIGIIAGPDLALQHYRSEKVVQVDVDRLPQWVREAGPKLGYIYDEPGGLLSVSTNLIKPVVRVQGCGIAMVGEEAIQEEYVFDCDIERKPVFNFLVNLPADLSVLNLVGPDVQDWEFHAGQPVLTVTFSRALLGKTQLHLFCERRRALSSDGPRAPTVTPLGGVFIRDTDQYSGWFAVATDANLDLKTLETRAMTSADIRDAPPLLQAYGHLVLGFRWTGDDWGLTCDAVPVAPRIEAKTRTALLFDAGIMRAITDVTWSISKATVRDLSIQLPPMTLSSVLVGKNIRSRELIGDTWHIRLDDPVKGEYSLRVAYEQLPDSASAVLYTGIRLPEAESEDGVVGAYLLDPQIEVNAAQLENVSRAEAAPGGLGLPAEAARFPFLGAFRHTQSDRRIAFQIKGHALAEGVLLHADNCAISSVVQADGGATSFMNCQVRNAGAQFFKLTLPKDAALWGAYVEGRPVRPNRLEQSGEILIPVLSAPRNAPFDVGVIWSEPTRDLGVGASLALASPNLALPAQDVDWNVYLPRDYQLVAAAGNMKLLQRMPWYEEGLPGVVVQHARAVWPAVAGVATVLFWLLVAAVAIYIVVHALSRLVKRMAARQAARAAEGKAPASVATLTVEVVFVLFVLLVLAGLLLPSLSRAREESRRKSSDSNLSQIVKACITYQEPNGDFFPPSLEALYPVYLDNVRVFHAPGVGGEGISYGYAPPVDPHTARPDTPVAWDLPGNYPSGGNVAFFDGHVKWVEADSDIGRALGYTNEEGAGARTVAGEVLGRGKAALIGPQQRPRPAAPFARASASAQPGSELRDYNGEHRTVFGFAPDLNDQANQQQLQAEAGVQQRAENARNLAQSNVKRGNYDEAEKLFSDALKLQPENQDTKDQLDRAQLLAKLAPQQNVNAPIARAAPATPRAGPAPQVPGTAAGGGGGSLMLFNGAEGVSYANATFSVSAIKDYIVELKTVPTEIKFEDLAADEMQRDILSLTTGRTKRIALKSGGAVELTDGELTVHGTQMEIGDIESATTALRTQLLAKAREVTAAREREESELAARKRAELEQRMQASLVGGGLKGGTISGNRGSGAMALDISFPSFGTRAYPFHMDYAGSSQARIELKCLHEGVALALQALVGLVLFIGLGAAWWRSGRAGLILTALVALALVVAWSAGGEIVKQYVVTGIAGVILSLPVFPVSRAARRAARA
jgi:prepilin-type processing-associated H-X9-DG protein